MKQILTILLLLAFFKSNGQKLFVPVYDSHKSDTIPTILLCADTSNQVSITLTRPRSDTAFFKGTTYTVDGFSQTTTFIIAGYRVAGNIIYQITSKNQLVDGLTYLDDRKRPLPSSFIVLSFVDRKQ